MKSLLNISFISLIILSSCDKVSDPFAHIDKTITNFGDPAFNDTIKSSSGNEKLIIIEDFTGHKCPNCPLATKIGKSIIAKNSGKVFVIGIHNSLHFSKPDSPKYPENFETETGENLRKRNNITSFPNGTINRKTFNGNKFVSITLWENTVNNLLNNSAYITSPLDIKNTIIYNTKKRTLRVFPEITVKSAIQGNFYFSVLILETGITSPQLDSRSTPSYIENYVHEHVLRKGFEQKEVGTFLFKNPSIGQKYKKDNLHIADDIINDNWKKDSIEIVTIVYNKDNNEIIQGVVTKLKK